VIRYEVWAPAVGAMPARRVMRGIARAATREDARVRLEAGHVGLEVVLEG